MTHKPTFTLDATSDSTIPTTLSDTLIETLDTFIHSHQADIALIEIEAKRWAFNLFIILLGVWLGSLLTIGMLVIPIIFASFDQFMAANVAVILFKSEGIISFIVILLLVMILMSKSISVITKEYQLLAINFIINSGLYFYFIPQLLAQRLSSVKDPIWHIIATFSYSMIITSVFILLVRRLNAIKNVINK